MEEKRTNTPPVPRGFERAADAGESFIIRRTADGSEFVWVPTAALPADGRLGREGGKRFGWRPYGYSGGAAGDVPPALSDQAARVEAAGGFYLSRWCLGRAADGSLVSRAGTAPLTGVSRVEAEKLAADFVAEEGVTSHLPWAAELDSAAAWLIEKGLLTEKAVRESAGRRDVKGHEGEVSDTGADPALDRLGLYDLMGQVDEWTQEAYDGAHLWGCSKPCAYPLNYRCYFVPYPCYTYCGFRAALTVELFK